MITCSVMVTEEMIAPRSTCTLLAVPSDATVTDAAVVAIAEASSETAQSVMVWSTIVVLSILEISGSVLWTMEN